MNIDRMEPNDLALSPSDPKTGKPILREQPGYYPGYSTLSQKAFWDQATRELVEERVNQTPAIRYFSRDQVRFWTCVFDHLLPQTDRPEDRRIPIVNVLDHRLEENSTDGFRYENMPPDREAYRLGEQAIQDEAQAQFSGEFLVLSHLHQESTLKAIHDGKPHGGREIWRKMSVHRFWQLMTHDAVKAYYAHPWAWDEIGFGGPAYPRAYFRLERGEPEPWEKPENRYEWRAPASSLSDEVENASEFYLASEQYRSHSIKGAKK